MRSEVASGELNAQLKLIVKVPKLHAFSFTLTHAMISGMHLPLNTCSL